MPELQDFTHRLKNGLVVKGKAYAKGQMSAKFQIWAREHGLTDEESLAVWFSDDTDYCEAGRIRCFNSDEKAKEIAERGLKKLEGVKEVPYLT